MFVKASHPHIDIHLSCVIIHQAERHLKPSQYILKLSTDFHKQICWNPLNGLFVICSCIDVSLSTESSLYISSTQRCNPSPLWTLLQRFPVVLCSLPLTFLLSSDFRIQRTVPSVDYFHIHTCKVFACVLINIFMQANIVQQKVYIIYYAALPSSVSS